jgi:multiple sugar transport system permease protein
MHRPAWIKWLRRGAFGLVLFWSGLPIALMVLASFKPSREAFAFPPRLLFLPIADNYLRLLRRWPDFLPALANSAIVAAGATLLAVCASLAAAYVYSRFRSPGLTASSLSMILVRMLPPIVVTLPLFPAINWLRLNDTQIVLILLYAAFFVSLGTWVLRAFIDQIPRELDEAAHIDGAGLFAVLTRVIAPLAAQGAVAVAVFVFVFAWNEFLFAFIFTTTRAKTAPLIVSEMLGAIDGVEWGILFAAATIQLVPVLLLVILGQRYIVAGLTAGAVKS